MTIAPSLERLDDLLRRARKAGADAADAVFVQGASLSIAERLGKPEKLERAEGRDLGLRVFVGKRQAIVSSSDISSQALGELADRAVAMAKAVPEDPFCGIADPADLATAIPELDLCDPDEPATETLMTRLRAAEDAARSVPGVTNSEGAEAGWSRSLVALAATNGFRQGYAVSSSSISVSVLAGEGTAMEHDYDFTSAVYGSELESPAVMGKRVGEKAVRRLNPRKVATVKVPIVYDPRVSNSIVGHLAGAINGAGIARGVSFLKDKMGKMVLPAGMDIIDDPHRRRGLRSRPFDGEGLANRRMALVEDGVLKTWVLDLRSARQLNLKSTGHAARGTSSPPGPSTTNLYLSAGKETPKQLMADIESGFYCTDLIGFGVNNVTGDYSRGASGFWIEKGELAYPVSEITIAGNLTEMFQNLRAANDLTFRFGTNAPTSRIDGMTVAGR
ncbi:MAG TPA: TldD/PmbA family protein [Dongiaceae bacterium]|jgi:PmbA protein|nr:TldD/PmbA family protein [Dongiaceae bacterium]